MLLKRFAILLNSINKFQHNYNKIHVLSNQKTSLPKKLVVYGDLASPPVRFTLMTAEHLNIQLDFHKIDLFKSENKTDFYSKINPIQKVPALSTNGEIICDSHAIALYLCGKNQLQELYTKDILIKAKVNQMLFFNATNLFPIDSFIFSEFFAGRWPVDQNKIKEWFSSLNYLEYRLTKTKWLTCDKVQLCDFCCAATISSLELLVPSLYKFIFLKQWMKELEELSCFEINKKGLERLSSFVDEYKKSLPILNA